MYFKKIVSFTGIEQNALSNSSKKKKTKENKNKKQLIKYMCKVFIVSTVVLVRIPLGWAPVRDQRKQLITLSLRYYNEGGYETGFC